MSQRCPRCGSQQESRARYCSQCAYALRGPSQVRRCDECGARVAATAETCMICGSPLSAAAKSSRVRWFERLRPGRPRLIMGGFLGAGAFALLLAVTQPWRGVTVATFYTPTPTGTPTSTPTPTRTPTPTETVTPTLTPTPDTISYRVQRGDSLLGLATRFETTVELIMAVNEFESERDLVWGVDIQIPVGAPTSPGESALAPFGSPTGTPLALGGPLTYVVQEGDLLLTIAERFDTTVEALMAANDLTSPESLQVGQELVIPEGGPSPTPTSSPTAAPTAAAQLYEAPALLAPTEGQEFRGPEANDPILLNWASVGVLEEDVHYLVTVRHEGDDGLVEQVTDLTRATSYRIPASFRPAENALSHEFQWEVAVVRQIGVTEEGTPDVELISPPGPPRQFFWF